MKSKLIDLTGKRFGRLVVIKRDIDAKHQQPRWLCVCDCGNIRVIRSADLRKKKCPTESCGCLRLELMRKEFGESSFNRLYGMFKRDAKYRKHKFLLTKEEVRSITKKNCFYCGKAPKQIIKGETSYGEYIYNGIDRVDNAKDYELDNVVPCCGQCNKAKYKYSVDEFKEWISRTYLHLFKS